MSCDTHQHQCFVVESMLFVKKVVISWVSTQSPGISAEVFFVVVVESYLLSTTYNTTIIVRPGHFLIFRSLSAVSIATMYPTLIRY